MKTLLAEEKLKGQQEWTDFEWWIRGFEDYVYWMNLGLMLNFKEHAVRKKR